MKDAERGEGEIIFIWSALPYNKIFITYTIMGIYNNSVRLKINSQFDLIIQNFPRVFSLKSWTTFFANKVKTLLKKCTYVYNII